MNIFTPITEHILRQLDAGVVPWHQSWANGLPKHLVTGQEFRGLNLLLLGPTRYTSRYWLAEHDAVRLGGRVRPGAQAQSVLGWQWHPPAALDSQSPPTAAAMAARRSPLTRSLFNLDQVENVPRPDDDTPSPASRRFEVAELMLAVLPSPPEILHARIHEPAYDARRDCITLPHLSQFPSAEAYYTARFLGHVRASGAPHRLHRFAATDGERLPPFSFEALVAELGAAFLCGFAGLRNVTADALPASRSQGWANALRADPGLLVRAAAAAQRAADYLRGKVVPDPVQATAAEPRLPQACHA